MKITILSLFPECFYSPFDVSMIKRAKEQGVISIELIDIRDFARDKHRRVDDRPYGGGPGMLMMPGPCVSAIRSVRNEDSHVVYLSPQGEMLKAKKCEGLAKKPHLILLCGHYEGIDQRVIDSEVDEVISIGDFVLTSGCLPAMVVTDAIIRFVPGVLGHKEAAASDSFQEGLLEGPQYTRPEEFEGMRVPEVLIGGNHKEIEKWRMRQSEKITRQVRPELIGANDESTD
ncbi:MAG: tRNA (guanosine(37)-N1)-methyltransferase TrmD [Simkaniaceae bacterium]|nr:tRNA (guanosine(37)-N1)-methyltransferase TrmD [Candidatus Sacchlamyda saccharinae]